MVELKKKDHQTKSRIANGNFRGEVKCNSIATSRDRINGATESENTHKITSV